MSEEKTSTASTNTANTTKTGSSAASPAPTARKKAPVKAAAATRRARPQRPVGAGSSKGLKPAALESQSRAQNPSVDDPFQGGQRIWPD